MERELEYQLDCNDSPLFHTGLLTVYPRNGVISCNGKVLIQVIIQAYCHSISFNDIIRVIIREIIRTGGGGGGGATGMTSGNGSPTNISEKGSRFDDGFNEAQVRLSLILIRLSVAHYLLIEW